MNNHQLHNSFYKKHAAFEIRCHGYQNNYLIPAFFSAITALT